MGGGIGLQAEDLMGGGGGMFFCLMTRKSSELLWNGSSSESSDDFKASKAGFNGTGNTFLVDADKMVELFDFSVFHEMVGESETEDMGRQGMVVHPFSHGRTHAAHAGSVFDGDDMAEGPADMGKHFAIEGFEESEVIVGHGYAGMGFLDTGYCLGCGCSDRAERDDCHVFSVLELPAATHGDFLEGAAPVDE